MNLQPKIIELLNKRGICTEKEIEEFLSDKPQKTYDPFLLLNMEAGVDLIMSSIEEGDKICIYGDYDADGVTSTAILMEVLGKLTDDVVYYIPSRFDEGYGLNMEALDKIKADGVNLVITVDCGSVSCEEVLHAREIGLKILVTDHHTITDKIADCLIINPAQKQCTYPFKYLAGCGVAFKLAQALVIATGLPKNTLTKVLDLVGVGTIGDIVPLVDENRTLAKYGIRAINVSQRPGLVDLINETSLNLGEIGSENIAYVIVPHINASGRMKDAKIAAKLMMEKDEEEVSKGVKTLIDCNRKRKELQSDTFEACKIKIEENHKEDNIFVVELEDAHEGITGIVAGKVKETYGKPTIIVTPTGEGLLKGTGRSVEGVNIYSLLKENDQLFLRFGGHKAACGFTMKKENLPALRENLNLAMGKLLMEEPGLLEQSFQADLTLRPEDVNLNLAAQLEMLEPFGCENPKPTIGINLVPTDFRKMGNNNQFSKFTGIMDNGGSIKCVIFNRAQEYDRLLQTGKRVWVIGTLGSQKWNGNEYLQINVLDVKEV